MEPFLFGLALPTVLAIFGIPVLIAAALAYWGLWFTPDPEPDTTDKPAAR